MDKHTDALKTAEPFLEAAMDGMVAANVPGAAEAMVLYGLDGMADASCCNRHLVESLEELSRMLAENIRRLHGHGLTEH